MTSISAAVLILLAAQSEFARVDSQLPAAVRVQVVGEADRAPIAGAMVTVTAGGQTTRVRTDVRGVCTLEVSSSRVRIRASAPGFIEAEYGALAVGELGTEISLTGTVDAPFTVALVRSAFVAGKVLGLFGEPLPDVLVTATDDGGRLFQQWTDYRGEFRLNGLPPGKYVVSVRPQLRFLYPAAIPSEAQVDKALSRLRKGVFDSSATDEAPGDRLRGLPTVYYPTTVDPELAVKLAVNAGTELFGIDLRLVSTGTSSISGHVDGLTGTVGVGSLLVATNVVSGASYGGSISDRGAFSFANLPPGTYRVRSRILHRSSLGGVLEPQVSWGEATVQVPLPDGRDLLIKLQDPIGLRGHLKVIGSAALSASFRLFLERVDLLSASKVRLAATISESGSFAITGIDPGTYRFVVEGSGTDGSPWRLREALSESLDLIGPFGLAPDKVPTNIALSVSTARASLAGTISDSNQSPMSQYYVLVFPALPALRVPGSPRLVLTRPATNGQYEVSDLPAGDYYVSVLTARPSDWNSPEFLAMAEQAAVEVSVQDARVTKQDLQVRKEKEN